MFLAVWWVWHLWHLWHLAAACISIMGNVTADDSRGSPRQEHFSAGTDLVPGYPASSPKSRLFEALFTVSEDEHGLGVLPDAFHSQGLQVMSGALYCLLVQKCLGERSRWGTQMQEEAGIARLPALLSLSEDARTSQWEDMAGCLLCRQYAVFLLQPIDGWSSPSFLIRRLLPLRYGTFVLISQIYGDC